MVDKSLRGFWRAMLRALRCQFSRDVAGPGTLYKSFVRRKQIQVPFQDDLTSADDDLFNLEDFQHYKESPDVMSQTRKLMSAPSPASPSPLALDDVVEAKKPMVFVSKLSDPYLNLAIEDYIYNKMPLPDTDAVNYNRLVFYVNSLCVVIGKNQNPWKEVNLPLLNSLHVPLLRRKSGGGTVVHDVGNVNYSFMTAKENFDRFNFVRLITDAVNAAGSGKHRIEVNERGDITTEAQPDGINYKISGSAYKLSRGKSYHHGTMLLNANLGVLGKLLSRNDKTHGFVDSKSSIASVRAKVTNLEIANDSFIEAVATAFKERFGEELELSEEEKEHNEMLGLQDFVDANAKTCDTFTITKDTTLNGQIRDTANELREWSWRYGNTPRFAHKFTHEELGFTVTFHIEKNAIVDDFDLSFTNLQSVSKQQIEQSFEFLREILNQSKTKSPEEKLRYTGSSIAGFITDDAISDWIGESIDGTN